MEISRIQRAGDQDGRSGSQGATRNANVNSRTPSPRRKWNHLPHEAPQRIRRNHVQHDPGVERHGWDNTARSMHSMATPWIMLTVGVEDERHESG